MGPYAQFLPIILVMALAPLTGIVVLLVVTMIRPPAGRPAFLRGFARVWLIACVAGAALGVVGAATSLVIFLLH